MRLSRLILAVWIALAAFASDSPDTREITDPKSITSQTEMGAAPVPIDDLFYTRGVTNPSWSPNGQEIAFSTNITGRYNLWKVNAAGSWPIQLSQSDDRQPTRYGRPTGSGSSSNRTRAEVRFTISSRSPAKAGKSQISLSLRIFPRPLL